MTLLWHHSTWDNLLWEDQMNCKNVPVQFDGEMHLALIWEPQQYHLSVELKALQWSVRRRYIIKSLNDILEELISLIIFNYSMNLNTYSSSEEIPKKKGCRFKFYYLKLILMILIQLTSIVTRLLCVCLIS